VQVKIDSYKPLRGGPVYGYVIYDENKKALESGSGFATKAYLDQAVAMRLRALRGLRPLRPVVTEASDHSMAVVQSWNDQIYGKEKK
jgi:hypothetical protein